MEENRMEETKIVNLSKADAINYIETDLREYIKNNVIKEETMYEKKNYYDNIPEDLKKEFFDKATQFKKFLNKHHVKYFTLYFLGNRWGCEDGKWTESKYDKEPFGEPALVIKVYDGHAEDGCSSQITNKFLKENGFNGYVECWDYSEFYLADFIDIPIDIEDKFVEESSTDKEIYILDREGQDVPEILLQIRRTWSALSKIQGDNGCCVLGEGMEFYYNGQKYKMSSGSPWQGEGSWTPFVDFTKEMLVLIGAKNIHYNYGNMD